MIDNDGNQGLNDDHIFNSKKNYDKLNDLITVIENDKDNIQPLNQSIKVNNIDEFNIKIGETPIHLQSNIKYHEIINFDRCYLSSNSIIFKHCVMCGMKDVEIPHQNKDVCKLCDSLVWFVSKYTQFVKFCKEFDDKPEASKCGRCRQRGRSNYITKKRLFSNIIYSSPMRLSYDSSPSSIATSYNNKSIQKYNEDELILPIRKTVKSKSNQSLNNNWEWDSKFNPLMQFAELSQHEFAAI